MNTYSYNFFFQFSVNGGWSDWIEESDEKCFESNGSWMKPRSRTCTNPEALYGGICLEDENGVFNESLTECLPSEFYFQQQLLDKSNDFIRNN